MSNRIFVVSELEMAFLLVAGGLFLLLLLYQWITYARLLRSVKRSGTAAEGRLEPVSVIVYARNESEQLRRNLPSLLDQDYPEYEVIVINDGSTDESNQVLTLLEKEHKQLYHTYIPEDAKYVSRKKLSLTVGIKAAHHDILLLTDAACRPCSDQWVREMASAYRSEKDEIVLGFCAYERGKGFLQQLIAFDNLVNALQRLSSALKHHPFAGDGRNLSYRKSLFFRQKGFSKYLNLQAGDDDLFINAAATRENTSVCLAAGSRMETGPMEQFDPWREMKVSRAATQHEYRGSQLFYYRSETFFFLLYLLATAAAVGAGIAGNWLVAAGAVLLYLLRSVAKLCVCRRSARLLGQGFSMAWMPLLEIALPLYNIYMYLYHLFRGKKDYTFRLGTALLLAASLSVHAQEEQAFPLPAIPATLTRPEARADYLVSHYWDAFDFRDTMNIHRPEVTEQAFANYLDLMRYVPEAKADTALKLLMEKSACERRMFDYFAEISEKYLYDMDSPLRNEARYIPVLEAILASPLWNETEKIRPRMLLELALKNRPGEQVPDFAFEGADGEAGRLYRMESPLLLLYFYDPACDVCQETMERLDVSPAMNRLQKEERLKVLAIYADADRELWRRHLAEMPEGWLSGYDSAGEIRSKELFEINNYPTLYLLDERKRVLLKACTLRQLEEYLASLLAE